jgi:hypothetical protein
MPHSKLCMLYAVCCALHVRAGHARRALPALLVHVVDVTIDAPARYPDLFTYFNVWISFSFLSAISDGLLPDLIRSDPIRSDPIR